MKILIAEDDTTSRLVLGATLKKLGHEVVATSSGRQAWEAFDKETVSLLISDWMMPDIDGVELCRLIRAENREQYTYIILLTARSGKSSYLEGMNAGADDFITKPFDEDQLAARLHVAERILSLHEKLRVQAMHDGMTGLLNRAAIVGSLSQELARAERDGKSVGVLLLDLDHFKQVNDTYGHAAGDDVLKETAQRLNCSKRAYDKVGRYGGEEFLVVVPECSTEDVLNLAERVRANINSEPVLTGVGMIPMSCSIGAAVSRSPHEAGDALIARADAALYRAKMGGRNRSELAQ